MIILLVGVDASLTSTTNNLMHWGNTCHKLRFRRIQKNLQHKIKSQEILLTLSLSLPLTPQLICSGSDINWKEMFLVPMSRPLIIIARYIQYLKLLETK